MSTVTRRFSFTGRKRISRDDIDIRIADDPPFRATVAIDSGKWHYPADAAIILEANQRMARMRFDFGTIEKLDIPPRVELSRLDPDQALSFRLKVVDISGSVGKLLGLASRIRAQGSDPDDGKKGMRAILPIHPRALGGEIWKIEFFTAGPELLINRDIPGLKDKLLHDVLLAGAVLPAALREILRRMCSDFDTSDEEIEIWNDWKHFCVHLGASALPDDSEESQDEWVDDVVRRFCAEHNFAQRVKHENLR